MKRKEYIKLFLSLLLMPLTLTSCIFDDAADDGPASDQKDPVLVLRTSVVGGTRAGTKEEINSLRIIVIAAQKSENDEGETVEVGTVEYNECKTVANGNPNDQVYFIPVSPGKKKIYVIANDESVKKVKTDIGNNNQYLTTSLCEELNKENTPLLQNDSIERLIFKPDYQDASVANIPLAGSKEVILNPVTRAEGDGGNQKYETTIYLVRAATKFDVTIRNNRSNPIQLEDFKINRLATHTYLFAHLFKTQKEDGSDEIDYFVHTFPNQTFDQIRVKQRCIFNGDNNFDYNYGKVIPWDEWLYYASNESQIINDTEDYSQKPIADKRGWIMDYDIPRVDNQLGQEIITWTLTEAEKVQISKDDEKPHELATRYYCESSYGKDEYQQNYTFDIKFKDAVTNETKEFQGNKFDNLRALFRNTHVKLDIELNETTVTYRIYVRPWKFYRLDEIIM